MKVIVAESSGFCPGVRNAINMAEKTLSKEKNVHSLGEIIHNKDVISEYQKKGVKIVDSITDIKDGIGVVRAHGLPKSIVLEAQEKGYHVIDATCPYVRQISRIIEKEIKNKSAIFLVGEPNHPEVIAASHDFAEYATVIDHKNFDPALFSFPKSKSALLSQTTMSEKIFAEIAAHFIKNCGSVYVYNTICPSTKNRQSSAVETAKKVEFMVILGGKNSSNTKRLYELCKEIVPSYHIERISELPQENIKGKKIAGITAGASTPDWIVSEAQDYLKKQ